MRINHNIAALNSHRQLSSNNVNASKNMEKLSSGLRINRAGDDAAGLSISEKMRGQIRGLEQASKNSQDAISLIQTGEGALNETHSILQRMRELAVQGANDTNVTADRTAITAEVTELASEIKRIADQTEFNTQVLFNGNDPTLSFQIGANAGQKLDVQFKGMTPADLKVVVGADVKLDTHANASASITAINLAIEKVSGERSKLGANQNRLEHTINNLGTSAENLTAAESRIRDVDMAKEMMEFTKNNILTQAAQAMLAQANQQPQGVLQLLR
jgi:flagellin